MAKGQQKKISIIPLGGLGEIGKNMTAFRYGEEIILVDAGLAFPDDEMLGIDLVIPNFSYLVENKDKVKAIFLTHGHEDHIGAMPYVMKELNCPVYGCPLTLGSCRAVFVKMAFQIKSAKRSRLGPLFVLDLFGSNSSM